MISLFGCSIEIWAHSLSSSYSFLHTSPIELNQDHIDVFRIAQVDRGCVTVNDVMQHLHWTKERAAKTLDFLLEQEIAQRDDTSSFYWLPCCSEQPIDVVRM